MVAAAIIGSAVVGGVMNANAAKSAANAQSGAAADANALQKYIFDEQVKLQQPWRDAGIGGLNRLSYLMGLSPTGYGNGSAGGGNGLPTMETPEQIRARLAQKFTTTTGGATPTAPVTAWGNGGNEAGMQSASGGATPTVTTVDEAKLAAAIQAEQARQKAAYDAAMAKATQTAGNDPNFGSLMDTFDLADFQADPGYQFRQDEGMKALERSAAARGGLFSGRAMKDTLRFSQGLASQEFGSAFDRFNVNKTNQFNRLASISGIGQTAANQTGGALANYGNNVSNNIIGAGNAQAAGRVGSANAWNSAIGQGISSYQQNQLLNSLNRPASTPTYYDDLGGGAGNYNYGGGF
jgi:hypothetical protein